MLKGSRSRTITGSHTPALIDRLRHDSPHDALAMGNLPGPAERPKTLADKFALAQEILELEVLPPYINDAIKRDDHRSLFPEKHRDRQDHDKLFKLLELGVIGEVPTPTLARAKYDSSDTPDIVTIVTGEPSHKSRRAVYANQADGKYTYDLALYTEGFSFCHALLVLDRNSGKIGLFHSDDPWMNETQRAKLLTAFPKDAPLELIFLYGSDSHHSACQTFFQRGFHVVKERAMHIASGPFHWGLYYNPADNLLHIKRTGTDEILTLPGFDTPPATLINDLPAHQEKCLKHNLSWALSSVLCYGDMKQLNGRLDATQFQDLTKRLSALLNLDLDPAVLQAVLQKNDLAFVQGETLVIPAGFAILSDTPETRARWAEVFEAKKIPLHTRFLDYQQSRECFEKLTTRLKDYSIETACSYLKIKQPNGSFVFLYEHAGELEVRLKEGEDSSFVDEVIKPAIMELLTGNQYYARVREQYYASDLKRRFPEKDYWDEEPDDRPTNTHDSFNSIPDPSNPDRT